MAALHGRTPALVLGKGVTALAAMRCLGRRGIPVYAGATTDPLLQRSRWYRPLPGTPLSGIPDGELDDRLAPLDVERLVLLPTSDHWAMAVSRLRPDLRARFPSTAVDPDVIQQLVDKTRFARAVVALGIPHPRTTLLDEPGSLASIPPALFRDAFLKPAKSGPFAAQFGAKAVRCANLEDAIRLVERASAQGLSMMLQEYIPGPPDQHYFLEGFIDRGGRLCGMLARRRVRMYPTDFGNSTATETIPVSDVAAAAESLVRLLEGIAYRGVFSAEFKHDARDGLFKILEVNARPWWFVGFAARCGLDVCDMAYRDALGEHVEPVLRYAIGRRCIAPRLDLEAGLADWRAGRSALWPFLRSWIGATQLIFAWDDPLPGVMEASNWSRSRLRRRLRW
ncbi:MAG TPA: hypothetical protein VGG65_05095 [Thermoanaerobaculia bacterium]